MCVRKREIESACARPRERDDDDMDVGGEVKDQSHKVLPEGATHERALF
jgi:hypothetical protein